MKLDIYQVDAFAETIFRGNPAAVVPLERWLQDELMQKIAAENNLAETAFFVKKDDHYLIRWFTPTQEVELCGHATLAAAHVLYDHLAHQAESCKFETMKRGYVQVKKTKKKYTMDFPMDRIVQITEVEKDLLASTIGIDPIDCVKGSDDYLVILKGTATVTNLTPNFPLIEKLNSRGLIISAKDGGSQQDFVSRCFFPKYGINEDPVTGSAHTLLAPYWSSKLGVNDLRGLQASARTGVVDCSCRGDRVLLSGSAQTYLTGKINLPHGV
jgi:PhzF family phenazine biosynthesis protein